MRPYESEARLKLLHVHPSVIVNLLEGWKHATCLALPLIENVPDDAKIVSVHYDHMRMTFCITMFHPSWDIIAEGDTIPYLGTLRLTVQFLDRTATGPLEPETYLRDLEARDHLEKRVGLTELMYGQSGPPAAQNYAAASANPFNRNAPRTPLE